MSAAIKPVSVPESQLPSSRRIYIDGTQPGVRVAFREIAQNATRNFRNELEENPPVRVYDTSNPYQPTEVAYFVPQVPSTARANSVNDVYVDENRIIYAVDRLKGGLYILELTI